MKVGVFVGTRADLSPLVPVLAELSRRDDLHTVVATAVAFDAAGMAAELAGRGVHLEVDTVGPQVPGTDAGALALVGAEIAAGTAEWLRTRQLDVLVVLGDRWELLYAVPPAIVLGVRVVHLHGGEITEGAIDDRIRHAITKLADQHAVATEGAVRIVTQLGEPAERIHRTGAPGLDLIANAAGLDAAGWLSALGVVPERPVALVTIHAPTVADGESPAGLARAVLTAVVDTCATAIVTYPGPDPGREDILAVLEEAAADPRVIVVPSLGRHYPQVLRSVDVVVGNSSSGVIEAACAGVPAVDVGDRQAGRERARSVRHATPDTAAIATAVRDALESGAVSDPGPYGAGDAAGRVVGVIAASADVPRRKAFIRVGAVTP